PPSRNITVTLRVDGHDGDRGGQAVADSSDCSNPKWRPGRLHWISKPTPGLAFRSIVMVRFRILYVDLEVSVAARPPQPLIRPEPVQLQAPSQGFGYATVT
ncbi:MAG: hypothetical protein WBO25_13630, partial [Acidimicrobiia bacterium]